MLTMYDHTLELTREVDEEVRDFFGEIVFQTVIPRDVAVSEAPSHGKPVIDYAPRSSQGAGRIRRNFAWRYSNVNKERRLGRGLEALLGQLPVRNEPARAGPASPAGRPTPATSAAAGAIAGGRARAAPSAEALFWLDAPHAAPGQLRAQPHHPPAQQPQSVAARPLRDGAPDASAPAPGRVSVRQIDSNPAQPRQDFDPDEMRSLAESLSAHGLLQPVVVRRVGDRYQLVAGERRLRAAIQAGWADVPVNVVEADDRQMAELAIVENLQRKDLNPLEKAASFQKYLDQYGCTQEELAGRLKLDRSTIANLIRLLELPEPVQDAIRRGKITQGHARALLPLGDEREQIDVLPADSARGAERAADGDPGAGDDRRGRPRAAGRPSQRRARTKPPARPAAKSEHIAALEQEFRTALGMKVKITPQRPRPRQAGRPVPQPRGVRAAEEARLRRGRGIRD